MSLTPQSERNRDTGEPPPESKPIYWLMVVLVLGLLVGWFYVQYGDLETAWDEAGDWIFWVFVAVAWLLPLLVQLLQKVREAGGGADGPTETLEGPGKHSQLPPDEIPDDKPIKPR